MAVTTTTISTRRTIQRASKAIPALPALPTIPALSALRTHCAWLQREARVVEGNITDLKRIYVRMGEASEWQDKRLPAFDETILFWQQRYRALIGQLTLTRAIFVHLVTTQQQPPSRRGPHRRTQRHLRGPRRGTAAASARAARSRSSVRRGSPTAFLFGLR